jgi:hypothetical protein
MAFRQQFQGLAFAFAVIASGTAVWSASAARIGAPAFPELIIPQTSGVNTGVTVGSLDAADLARMREAGIRFMRFDLFWGNVERAKGVYDWSGYAPLIAKLKAEGIKPILILDYNNELYDPEGGGIRTEAARQGFARYAAAAVAHFNRQVPGIIWEIWNEPNSNDFWKPERNADEFAALVIAAARAMRAADPTATIISGGVLELNWSVTQAYLERCFALGMLKEIDGLGVHLYGGGENIDPERIAGELAYIRDRMAAHGAPRDFPILNTEFGAQLKEYESLLGASREQQELGHAGTYVRMYLLTLLEQVRMNVWYEWRWREDFSGHALVNSDGSPRAVYKAIATVNRELDGYAIERRIDDYAAEDFVLVLKKGDRRKLALWTARSGTPVSIRVTGGGAAFPSVGMMGEAGEVRMRDGAVAATLTGAPVYIDLGTAAPSE